MSLAIWDVSFPPTSDCICKTDRLEHSLLCYLCWRSLPCQPPVHLSSKAQPWAWCVWLAYLFLFFLPIIACALSHNLWNLARILGWPRPPEPSCLWTYWSLLLSSFLSHDVFIGKLAFCLLLFPKQASSLVGLESFCSCVCLNQELRIKHRFLTGVVWNTFPHPWLSQLPCPFNS